MKTGFYCIVQFQPDRFRREGVNVGVLVASDEPREFRLHFVETAARVRAMFPGVPIDDTRFAAATRALERRLLEIEPTEEVRAFFDKESSQLVVLPPMPAVVDDLDATLARLFEEFVADPRSAEYPEAAPDPLHVVELDLQALADVARLSELLHIAEPIEDAARRLRAEPEAAVERLRDLVHRAQMGARYGADIDHKVASAVRGQLDVARALARNALARVSTPKDTSAKAEPEAP